MKRKTGSYTLKGVAEGTGKRRRERAGREIPESNLELIEGRGN